MKTEITFKKFDPAQQQVYAEVYLPMVADSQGDFMTAEGIEGIAHNFMGSGKVRAIDTEHDGVPNGSFVIESFIAKTEDKTFIPGSWVLGLKVPDPNLWTMIESGELKGLSMEGNGTRTETVLKGKPARRLDNVTITSVSIVKKSANREVFKIVKHDNGIAAIAKQFEAIAAQIQQQTEAIQQAFEVQQVQQAQIDQLSKGADGRIRKVTPSNLNPNADKIDYEVRKMERLQSRLESCWLRPDLPNEATEAELNGKIQKCADKLFALGHTDSRAGLDSNSAFLQRGGSSTFLTSGISTLDDILGVSRQTQELRKHEDSIDISPLVI